LAQQGANDLLGAVRIWALPISNSLGQDPKKLLLLDIKRNMIYKRGMEKDNDAFL
jgi:hypothetical protein